jgi:hypothetical protein
VTVTAKYAMAEERERCGGEGGEKGEGEEPVMVRVLPMHWALMPESCTTGGSSGSGFRSWPSMVSRNGEAPETIPMVAVVIRGLPGYMYICAVCVCCNVRFVVASGL